MPAHEASKTNLSLPDDTFLSLPQGGDAEPVRWVKFLVPATAPGEIYFQDSRRYPFHYDFARDVIPAFADMSRGEFDAVTLQNEGRKAILGAVIAPLDGMTYPEYGVQLVSKDDLHPELVEQVLATVQAHVTAPEGTRPYYFPTSVSAECALGKAADFAERGIEVGSVDRWLAGDACYAPGWAVGKLVELPAAEVDAAYVDGRLTPDDVLLLSDTAPAELPFVAGVLTLAPSTPNAHTAILARSYSVPFVYLRQPESRARARALAGSRVAFSTTGILGRDPLSKATGFHSCAPRFIDASGLSDTELGGLRERLAPLPVMVMPKRASGALSLPADGLLPADIDRVGGKAAHFGLLRATAPDQTPSPALALTFDAWDAFLETPAPSGTGSLREEIARRLAPHTWPADVRLLDSALKGIRDLIEEATFPAALASSVKDALAGFDPAVRLRFRSSTNVEDSETFTGAGLYDSATGCLADDLDADATGPSLCNPATLEERGVYRALQRVYASLYFRNAYVERLRRGINEADIGMGVLVHYSVPDPQELANGVATLTLDESTPGAAELVSQAGAVSVTNPGGTARPESVRIDRHETDHLSSVASSSLVQLGGHVLEWEADYRSLMDLFTRVADHYAEVTSKMRPFALDFEYKKIAPGELSLRQVRPLPLVEGTRNVTPFLVGQPEKLCIYSSEFSDVFATHRLKSRIALESGHLPLSAERLAQPLYTKARVEYLADTGPAVLEGDPSNFAGAAHAVETDGDEVSVRDTWTAGAGSWTLSARVPPAVSRSESPVRTFDDFFFHLGVTWSAPVPFLTYDSETGGLVADARSSESVELWGFCPEDITPTASFVRQEQSFAGPGGLAIQTSYWFPPPPRGETAGYTAPVIAWERTTISGLTSEPIVLTGYFSQTYAPKHHNFGGQYIFDPRLEPGLSDSARNDLAAASVAYLVVVDNDGLDDELWAAGMDGALRRL